MAVDHRRKLGARLGLAGGGRFLLCLICLGLAIGRWPEVSFAQKPVQRAVEDIGTALQFIVPTFVFGRTIYEPDNEDSTAQFARHFLFTLGVTHLTKALVDRRRPSGRGLDSFPSGHTAAAFSGATFVHLRYSPGEAKYLYALSLFTAFSRVYGDRHYLQDVLASMALSYLSGYIFVKKRSDLPSYSFGFDPVDREIFFSLSFALE
ncbi:MAG: phosphatase PAP2 family protein [Rickettsiales bacterium]|jgi:membrane-associated phospholipid phosphatase|nr:phosphatase PAP2 family protein [Rickettsiales bacterium]